mmetsp:Transcript_8626/g.24210  ORF Transcript_8626/g.24210 Transcript_8626/m.24210 type:complete len:641 (+) Transcript_8626:437-2359(+)
MSRRLLDLGGGLLQIEQSAAARRARNELGLGVAHAASLQEGEGRPSDEVDREGGGVADLLHEDAVPGTVGQEGADLHAHLEGELVGFGGVGLEVVDDGGGNVLGLENLKDAAGGVEVGKVVGNAEQDEGGVEVPDLLELVLRLGSVDGDGEADGAGGQSPVLGNGIRELHEGDGVGEGILLQLLGGHDDAHVDLGQSAEGGAGGGVVGGGDFAEEDGIGGGDVLEGHADGGLAPELLVQVLDVLLLEHVGGDGGDDAAVLVEDAADVDGVGLPLLGEGPLPAGEGGDVAGVGVGGDGRLPLGGLGVAVGQPVGGDLGEAVARLVLELGILGEGNADRVAEAVGEEGSDADGRLHPAVLTLPGLRDAEVEGVVPVHPVHLGGEEAVGLDHDEGVGRLHGEDEVVVVLGAADVGELEGRLDHAAGGVAVEGQDAAGQRAVVGTDAHAPVELLALLDEGQHGLDEVLALRDVVGLRLVHLLLEVLPAVGEVAGVDPDLLDGVGNELGDDGLEVHVGAQRDVVPLLEQSLPDLGGGVGLPPPLDGDADQVEPLVGAPHHLLDGAVDVGRGGRGHGLPHDGMVGAELDRAAVDRPGLAARDAVQVLAVLADGTHGLVAGPGLPRRGPQDVLGGRRVGLGRHAQGR